MILAGLAAMRMSFRQRRGGEQAQGDGEGAHGRLAVFACRSPQGLGHLEQLLSDLRIGNLVLGAYQLQRFPLGHGIELVTRRLFRPAAPFSSRRAGRNRRRHVIEEILNRHVEHAS